MGKWVAGEFDKCGVQRFRGTLQKSTSRYGEVLLRVLPILRKRRLIFADARSHAAVGNGSSNTHGSKRSVTEIVK